MNLLGCFLGKDSISLQNDHLIVLKKGAAVASYSIIGCKGFAAHKMGFAGGVLSIHFSSETIIFKFLRKAELEAFVTKLNDAICAQLNEYIAKLYGKYTALVIREYPRDSWIAEISDLCSKLHKYYSAQQALWNKYLSPNQLKMVEEIAGLYPIRPEEVRNRHEVYQLNKRSDFFDIVESNPLTQEQRLGVLRSNDRNMVLAAAGTGKTSVMVAKALDLIDRGLAKPSEILVLAYNRAAAYELKERLINKASKGNIVLETSPLISTFHALGRKLLREAGVPTNMSVFTDDGIRLKQWVTNWICDYICAEPTRIYALIELSTPPVNPFDFKSKAEYERYIRDNEFRTLNNEKVKGYQELLIANFLFMNQIPYLYEAPYVSKRRIDVGFCQWPTDLIHFRSLILIHPLHSY